jgi:adenine-specific DNA-methyltransferase
MKVLQKLELTWIGKDEPLVIEPRILLNNINLNYGISMNDNILIHGDNLLALKTLEKEYTNKIKCIYIDPPYNTGNAFEYYDDNLEHSIWLNLMRPRLELLKNLLTEDGSIFVQIDYNEHAYLKVLMDEIFGRKNFLTMITCKVKAPSGIASGANAFFDVSEYILAYSKNKDEFNFNPTKIDSQIIGLNSPTVSGAYNQQFIKFETEKIKIYSNLDDIKIKVLEKNDFGIVTIPKKERTELKYYNDYKNIFQLAAISGGRDKKVLSYLQSLSDYDPGKIYSYQYIASQGKSKGKEVINFIYKNRNILFLKDFVRVEDEKKIIYKQDILTNLFYNDWWQGLTGEGGVSFKNGQKPEKLIHQILQVSTNPGDLVLDSFLGSGTTAAVAHKMGRRWIGVEMGDHAYTHCKVRLDKVIDGTDQGGITKAVNWNGGGGYRFYELAPTLIKKDNFGQHIINPLYNPEMLASAIAKHEGYVYSPDDNIYWKQSKTNENSFLFVTTNHMSREVIESINQSMAEGEYLLIVCRSYDRTAEKSFKNIRMKKMPQSLLKNCEFDVENYNLNIINPPAYEEDEMLEEEGGDNNEQKDKYSTC